MAARGVIVLGLLAALAGRAAGQAPVLTDVQRAAQQRQAEWQRLAGLRPRARPVPGPPALHADLRLSADGELLHAARRRERPEAQPGAAPTDRFELVQLRVADGAATVVRDLGTDAGAGQPLGARWLVTSSTPPRSGRGLGGDGGHAVHVLAGAAPVAGPWDELRLERAAVVPVGSASFVYGRGADLMLCAPGGPPRRLVSGRGVVEPVVASPGWPFVVLAERPDPAAPAAAYTVLDLSEPPRVWLRPQWREAPTVRSTWAAEWGDGFAVVTRSDTNGDGAVDARDEGGGLWHVDPERPAERLSLGHAPRVCEALPLPRSSGLGLLVTGGPAGVEVLVVDPTSGGRQRLLRLEGGDFERFSVSADGGRLACLWVTDTNGDGARRASEDLSTPCTVELR